jgi:hypothetical protein
MPCAAAGQRRKLARVETDELAGDPLGEPFAGGPPDQHPGVAWLHTERGEPFAKLPGQVRSELHQQISAEAN